MKDTRLYDITEVCKMLGITSRTLRFYEEKGIIQSTTVGVSSRRQYTEKQLSLIRNVLVLRTLGLSIRSIVELQNKHIDLKQAVLSKRAEIYSSIDKRIHEINLLNEALSVIEAGNNIFAEDWQHAPSAETEEKHLVELCSDAIVNGHSDVLYEHLSPRMAQYMPQDVWAAVRNDTFAPLGDFVSFDRITVHEKHPNKIYRFVKFSKLGLKITFVFYEGKIDGLWLNYCDTKSR